MPQYDWQKYHYTYRVWGRLNYSPDTDPDAWRRFLHRQFGAAAEACEAALANASRVLPLVTLMHAPSASNNSYWPEIYSNVSLIDEVDDFPYGHDSFRPARYSNVGAFDPQLFSSPEEFAKLLLADSSDGRYSPLDVAAWLDGLATQAEQHLAHARTELASDNTEFRRWAIDITIQSALGRFFAAMNRAACWWELYLQSAESSAAEEALSAYLAARDAWKIAAEVSKDCYVPDLSYGPQPWSRGCWNDRLATLEQDILKMEQAIADNPPPLAVNTTTAKAAIEIILAWRPSQRVSCHHPAPERFQAGSPLQISFSLNDGATPPARLYYRHVNQAETWQVAAMSWDGEYCFGVIPAIYTDTVYPLQYYFELDQGNRATLCPGLADDLSNEPYYTVRRA